MNSRLDYYRDAAKQILVGLASGEQRAYWCDQASRIDDHMRAAGMVKQADFLFERTIDAMVKGDAI